MVCVESLQYRREACAVAETGQRQTSATLREGSMSERLRPQRLFIVSRDDTATFRSLARVLSDDDSAQVIYDRRLPMSRRVSAVWSGARVQALGERRRRPEVDAEIRLRGWTCVEVEAG